MNPAIMWIETLILTLMASIMIPQLVRRIGTHRVKVRIRHADIDRIKRELQQSSARRADDLWSNDRIRRRYRPFD